MTRFAVVFQYDESRIVGVTLDGKFYVADIYEAVMCDGAKWIERPLQQAPERPRLR